MKAVGKLRAMISKARQTGLGHIFGANTINQIIAFASSFILIRILSKSENGVYSYAFNIYSFFALMNGFGIESACLQRCSETAKNSEKADSYLKFGRSVWTYPCAAPDISSLRGRHILYLPDRLSMTDLPSCCNRPQHRASGCHSICVCN